MDGKTEQRLQDEPAGKALALFRASLCPADMGLNSCTNGCTDPLLKNRCSEHWRWLSVRLSDHLGIQHTS